MKNKLVFLKNEEAGQGMVEYSLILALIVLVCIAAVKLLGENASEFYNNATNQIPG
jgi:pilus assembly protein Flp/PilA